MVSQKNPLILEADSSEQGRPYRSTHETLGNLPTDPIFCRPDRNGAMIQSPTAQYTSTIHTPLKTRSKLLLPFQGTQLSCQQLKKSKLQRQLVMKPVCILQFLWKVVTEFRVLQDSSTVSLDTVYVHAYCFCYYLASCFQTHVPDLLTRTELTQFDSIHACTQALSYYLSFRDLL